jgi:hypothetical protein
MPVLRSRPLGTLALALVLLPGLETGGEPSVLPQGPAKGVRIGLVYADFHDPAIKDPFHRQVCATFADLARRHPAEIRALTDPDVTADRLRQMLADVDFLFYWGHGGVAPPDAVVYGSKITERLDVREFGRSARCKAIYLDGCELGTALKDRDREFPDVLLACPDAVTSFDSSVRMGCGVIADIFGARQDVRHAFERSAKQPNLGCAYRIIGKGKTLPVALSAEARGAVVHAFLDLLLAWNAQRGGATQAVPGATPAVEGEYSSTYPEVKNVRITKTGDVYKVRWNLANGGYWVGVGLLNKQAGTFSVASAVSTGKDDQYANGSLHAAVFRVEQEGGSIARLVSDCARYGDKAVHNKTLTPKKK